MNSDNIAVGAIFAFLIGLFVFAGCSGYSTEDSEDVDRAWTYHGMDIKTKVVEIEGHKYVLMDGIRCGGIIHCESCSCKSNCQQ